MVERAEDRTGEPIEDRTDRVDGASSRAEDGGGAAGATTDGATTDGATTDGATTDGARADAGPASVANHRIGDAERQQAIDILRGHTAAGRLTLDEFSDLAGEVYAAQTYGELEAVGRKLPPGLRPQDGDRAGVHAAPGAGVPPGGSAGAGQPAGSAGPMGTPPGGTAPPAADVGRRRTVVAVMCGAHPRGHWRPASHLTAVAFWGGVHVDLRDADLAGPVTDICAWAVMGGVTVTVPEGTRVELDGPVIMGGADDTTGRSGSAPAPDAPLVRVHARVWWGGLEVRNPSRKKRLKRALAEEARRVAAEAQQQAADVRHATAVHQHELLQLPQRILDDLDLILHDRRDGHARVRTRAWPPAPPSPPPASPPPPATPPPAPPSPMSTPTSTASPPRAPGEPAAPKPTGTLTMMVTDVADSTRLAEQLGDRRWIGVMGEHNALVREQVAKHGGTEVKALGDGFLVVYPSARRAILSAVDVQRALATYGEEHPETPLVVRIGLHTGEIVDLDGDVLGQNVVVAARLADHAAPGEIVVSGLTRDLTVAGGDLAFGPACDVELKGLSQPWRVHTVSWAPTAPATPAS
jgi:class 3 adenylate cyclase